MPQNDYIEEHQRRHGRRLDHYEKKRKYLARAGTRRGREAQKLTGIKAKIHHRRRFKEKAALKKTINQHFEKDKIRIYSTLTQFHIL